MNRALGAAVALAASLISAVSGHAQESACVDGLAGRYACDRVDLLGHLPRAALGAADTVQLNDVWGWTDARDGREYALVGRMDGVAFVDVTEPGDLRYLGSLPATAGSRITMWRDVKVYSDHALVVAGGTTGHGMQVFDLTALRDAPVPRDFAPTVVYRGIESAINIAVNEDTGFAYLAGSTGEESCGGGLHMVDIRNPVKPVFAGCFAHPGTGRAGTGTSHDAQCVLYRGPDADYRGREICLSANETALSIADVTDKSDPAAIARARYPAMGYAHQGWLTDDHRHFYMGDELDEALGHVAGQRVLAFDVSDLDDPVVMTEHIGPAGDREHNLYVQGDLLYVALKRSGLRVLDIGDRERPVEAGFFDTTLPGDVPDPPAEAAGFVRRASRFVGAWSVYPFLESGNALVSSRSGGLFVVGVAGR